MFEVFGDTVEFEHRPVLVFLPGVQPTLREAVEDVLAEVDPAVSADRQAELETENTRLNDEIDRLTAWAEFWGVPL